MGTNRRRSATRLGLAILLVLGTLAVALIGRGRTLTAASAATLAVADLGTLGGRNSAAVGVNGRGQVVGWAETDPLSEEDFHAFLWQDGQMNDLGTLRGRTSMAFDINDAGQVVGWAENTAGESRAVLWRDGVATDLGTLGGHNSSAVGINREGQVVGWAEIDPSSEAPHAFVWEAGQMTDLGTLGGASSKAFDINDRGQIVGEAEVAAGEVRAVVWEDGKITELDVHTSYARSLNSQGQVVGGVDLPDGTHATLWDSGAMTDLGTLGSNSYANGIDDAGRVVGAAEVSDQSLHAFLWEAGKMTDLGTLGGVGSSATAASLDGTIVGWADTASDEQHASLWAGGPATVDLLSAPPAAAREATPFATPSPGVAASAAAATQSPVAQTLLATPSSGAPPVGTPIAETRGVSPCEDVLHLDFASKTRNLLADCTTDRPLVIPDGWTFDGNDHVVFAVDPVGSRLTDGVVMVTGGSGNVRDVTIDGSRLTAPCEVDRGLTSLEAVQVLNATAEVTGVTVQNLRRPLPTWATPPPEGSEQSISESCGTGIAILGEDAWATVSANTVADVGHTGILVEVGQATIVDNVIRESDDSGVLLLLGARSAVGPGNVITDGVVGIQVEGEGSFARVTGNTVEHMEMMGISIFQGGAGSVSSNQITDVAAGVTVEYTSGTTRVVDNQIEHPREVGIHLLEADAEVAGNALAMDQPTATGITARGSATFTATDNIITGSAQFGLLSYLVENADITGNTIEGPGVAILLGGADTRGVLAENTIAGEPAVGIGVFERAEAAITGNRVSGATEAAIVGISEANLREVSGNSIDASYYGIQVSEQGTRGTVNENAVSNSWRGIVVERGASADLQSNTIATTTQAIAVLSGARATVADNAVSGGATGILVEDHGSAVVEGNTIRDVTYAGVVFERSAAASTAGNSVTTDEQAEITAHDIYFEPKEVLIPANTDVTCTLPNDGFTVHNFSIDQLGVSVDIAAGETQQVIINAPAGVYEYYCNVPGHKEAGMVGTLVVRADAATSESATSVAPPVPQTPDTDAELEDAIRRNTIEGSQIGILVKGAGLVIAVEGNHVESVTKTGISIQDQAMADVVGNTVDDASTGITIADAGTRATLSGNRITDTTARGVSVHLGAEALLSKNTVTRAGASGIVVTGSGTTATLEGNFVIDAAESGILIERAATMIAEANYVTGGTWGISILSTGTKAEVRGNQVENALNHGIGVAYGAHVTIADNQVTGGDAGIDVRSEGTVATVTGNWVSNPVSYGIYVFDGASAELITGNTVSGTEKSGILITGKGTTALVEANTLRDFSGSGIGAENGASADIIGNEVDGGKWGISAVSSNTIVTIRENTVSGAEYQAISVSSGAEVTIADNHLTDSSTGIVLSDAATTGAITGNTVRDMRKMGIRIDEGASGLITGNSITDAAEAGIYLASAGVADAADNWVSGGKQGIAVLDAGTLAAVHDNRVSSARWGIVVMFGGQATIADNQVTGGDIGIYLRSEETTGTITGNWVSDAISKGISVSDGAAAKRIEENTVIGSRSGIVVSDADIDTTVVVTGNTVRDAGVIGIEGSNTTITITDNILRDSRRVGIQVGPAAVVEVTGNTLTGTAKPTPYREGPYGIRVLPDVSGTIIGNQVANHHNPDPGHTACGIVIDAEAPGVVVSENRFPDPGNEVEMCDERPLLPAVALVSTEMSSSATQVAGTPEAVASPVPVASPVATPMPAATSITHPASTLDEPVHEISP